MRTKLLLSLLWASTLAMAATPNFLLGVDYSQWLVPNVRAMATDAAGAIYVFNAAGPSNNLAAVTKLSADGKTLLWRNQLPTSVTAMAVDPSGGVYVTLVGGDGVVTVAKLNDGGSGIAWTSPALLTVSSAYLPALAVDASGRAYVTGYGGTALLGTKVLRLAANGSTVEYSTTLSGRPNSIAVDATGAAFVAGATPDNTSGFVARFTPDGTPGFNVPIPNSSNAQSVLVDTNGNAVIDSNGVLTRLDSTGNVVSSIAVGPPAFSSFALDKAGNAYVMGSGRGSYYTVKNSLAPCGTEFLSVVAPDGTVLQTTYLPGTAFNTVPPIAIGKDGNVLMAVWPAQSFVPTRPGPLPAGQAPGTGFLLSLSANANADTFPLACMTSAADYTPGSISPGELLALFGNGLGPQVGVQRGATLQSPFPTKVGDVQVTFDGTPAPILYAQDGQVNVVAPWSLKTTGNTQVCVTYSSASLRCLTWPTAHVSPGIFLNYDKGAYAATLNQDGSLNSATNPATAGSIVSVFATGLGAITPPQADGSLINLPLPKNVVTASVEGSVPSGIPFGGVFTAIPLEVTYNGPAPFRVAGISQINFRVNSAVFYTVKVATVNTLTYFSQPFHVYVAAQ